MSYIGQNGSVYAYVPDNCRVDPSSATQEGSARIRLDSWQSFVASLIPSFVPGIVLGAIAAAGFVFFLLQLCVRYRRRKVIAAARAAKAEQAAKGGGAPRGCTAGRALKWLIVLFALAVVGVSAWGLAESILATDGLLGEFWRLVDDVEALAAALGDSLSSLAANLATLSATLVTAQALLQKVVDAIGGIPVIGGLIGRVVPLDKVEEFLGTQGDAAVAAMNEAVAVLNGTVVPVIEDNVLPAINSIQQNQSWADSVDETWRYVVFACMFGLLILAAAAAAATCRTMRRGMWATGAVCALWALNALVCFLGMGLLNGAKTAADQACLYSEELATRAVVERLEGDAQRIAQNALDYYVGKTDLVDAQGNPLLTNGTTECSAELSAALLRQVAGIDLSQALVYAWELAGFLPTITDPLAGLNLPTIPLVNFDLNSITDPLVETSQQLTAVLDDVCNVTLLLLRENTIQPLYFRAKTYVCCDLTDAIYRVWVPWVCAGVLTLVLSILASIRVISSTLRPSGLRGPSGRPEDGQGDGGKASEPDGTAEAPEGGFIVATEPAEAAPPGGEVGGGQVELADRSTT